jgi:hypothetical protein
MIQRVGWKSQRINCMTQRISGESQRRKLMTQKISSAPQRCKVIPPGVGTARRRLAVKLPRRTRRLAPIGSRLAAASLKPAIEQAQRTESSHWSARVKAQEA